MASDSLGNFVCVLGNWKLCKNSSEMNIEITARTQAFNTQEWGLHLFFESLRVFLVFVSSDLKLHLQSTDYGSFLANEASPLTVSVIDDKLKEKMVVEFRHMRNQSYEPLASFMDFITWVQSDIKEYKRPTLQIHTACGMILSSCNLQKYYVRWIFIAKNIFVCVRCHFFYLFTFCVSKYFTSQEETLLSSFPSYCFFRYSYMIDNVILLITGTLHQRAISELVPKCHPLGSFEQMEAVNIAQTPAELYNAILVDTPLGKTVW